MAHDLAHLVARDLLQPDISLGCVRAQRLHAGRVHGVPVQGSVRDDSCPDFDCPVMTRHAEGCGIPHAGDLAKDAIDGKRADLVTATVDKLIQSACDDEHAIRRYRTQVARIEPAGAEGMLARGRIIKV